MSMVGEEQATAGADDVVVSDGVAVNINTQANGFVAEDEKGRTTCANSAGSLGDGSFAFRSGNTPGSSGDGFRTYKRRKHAQAEDTKVSASVASQIEEKVIFILTCSCFQCPKLSFSFPLLGSPFASDLGR